MSVRMARSTRAAGFLAVSLVVLPIGAKVAEACECYDNPPCAAVWKADAVFVGTVVETMPEPLGGTISWTVQKIAVNQQLHGSVESSVTLVPNVPRPTNEELEASRLGGASLWKMSTCDYTFEVGRQYVIYARKTADGRWTTSLCAGTKPVAEATADFEYISRIPGTAPTGRVYGSIERIVAHDTREPAAPAAGVRVELRGPERRTVTTDRDGKFDVQVPPGDYTIAPVVPETIRVYGAPFQTSVAARGCAPVQFGMISNGRVEGRVARQDGSPVARAQINVIRADLSSTQLSEPIAESSTTDENGHFLVEAILPGRYVVAINARFGPRLDSPYATTYPGVVELGDGEHKSGFTIVVSPLAETTVSGTVVLDGGRPAAGADVSANLVDHRGTSMSLTKTDSNGAFELRVLTGMTYVIRAGVRRGNSYSRSETIAFVDQPQEGLILSIR